MPGVLGAIVESTTELGSRSETYRSNYSRNPFKGTFAKFEISYCLQSGEQNAQTYGGRVNLYCSSGSALPTFPDRPRFPDGNFWLYLLALKICCERA